MPINYILLLVFTACYAYITAGFVSYFNPVTVLAATVTTGSMVVGLTIYALCMSTEQLSFCYGLAFGMTLAVFPIIIFSLFFMNYWLYMLIQGFFVLLACVYIIYDTRIICEKFSYDDYIVATVTLYIDILMLFIYLLKMFGATN